MILLCRCKQLRCSEKRQIQLPPVFLSEVNQHPWLLLSTVGNLWIVMEDVSFKSYHSRKSRFPKWWDEEVKSETNRKNILNFFLKKQKQNNKKTKQQKNNMSPIKKKSICLGIVGKDTVYWYWSGSYKQRSKQKGSIYWSPLQQCFIDELFLSAVSWRREPHWCKLKSIKLRFGLVEYFVLDSDAVSLFSNG